MKINTQTTLQKIDESSIKPLKRRKDKWLGLMTVFGGVAARFAIDVLDHLGEWNTDPRYAFWVGSVVVFGSLAGYFAKKYEAAQEEFEEAKLLERLQKYNIIQIEEP